MMSRVVAWLIFAEGFSIKVIGHPKTSTVMANIKTVFLGTERSETNDVELECFINMYNEIVINIEGDGLQYICLDRETAIRLAKNLRKEIAELS